MPQTKSVAGTTQFVTPRDVKTAPASESTTAPSPVPQQEEEKVEVSAPIPTMGWPAFWYEFVRTFNKNAKPPRLSKKEIAIRAEQAQIEEEERQAAAEIEAKRRRAEESVKRERQLTDKCTNLVVAFVGVKGAAATTTTMVNSASVLADDTRTLVYGADFNPASGTAGARLGKDFGETVSIQQFAELVDELKGDRRAVNARLRPTRYGVRVLSADDYVKIPGEQYGTTTEAMLEVLAENCDYLLLDTPNDITTPAARAVLAAADIIVFTANVGERDSLRLLRVSMDTVRALGHAQKVADSVVAISNVPEGAGLEGYVKYLGHTNLDHEPTSPVLQDEFSGQMLMVSFDPIIALNGEVKLEAYRPETIQAYRDINIAVFEQAIEIEARIALNALGRS